MIRYYFKINTDLLSDEEFFKLWAKLEWVLEQKQHANKSLTHG